ncbi:MAG: hypothetical protein JNK76_08005 [Planctomycetales bacterium]|nr:hypothetical protein [Planctomycetales bacterium]MBN8624261.1 hypothetical protein [Planctomycetota bacterium]
MKFALLLLPAALLCGCASRTEPEVLSKLFQAAIEREGEVVFKDSSQLGADADGSILTLHFRPDAKVHLYTWGNGFSNYSGTYAFTEQNGIELSLSDQSWPRLRLVREGDLFVLRRQDGLSSLTKSYVHTDRETGVRTIVDDGDIYPEARPLIFPLTQRIATAARLSQTDRRHLILRRTAQPPGPRQRH